MANSIRHLYRYSFFTLIYMIYVKKNCEKVFGEKIFCIAWTIMVHVENSNSDRNLTKRHMNALHFTVKIVEAFHNLLE